MPHRFYPLILIFAVAFLAGCGGSSMPSGAGNSATLSATREMVLPDSQRPLLITLDLQGGELEAWPIRRGGSSNPRPISASLGIYQGYGLVANGNTVAIANYSPAEVVTYNVKTKVKQTLADTSGSPIDIAIDKHATLYALNLRNVVVYHSGSSQPSVLSCKYINSGVAIAVDNEGDVFVNGYGNNFMGVIEYPSGSEPCTVPHLRAERGYAGGVGVDPKTDDLIVVDDPDLCAGGLEGRMIVYPKPYEQRTSFRRNLNANYCAGTFRLSSTSGLIFVSDATISAGYPLIDQRTYPAANGKGLYQAGEFGSSGYFGGFTTIPNTLPN